MIYQIPNFITGKPDYIVTADDPAASNTATNITVGPESDAIAKLLMNQQELLLRESHRFLASKVVQDGTNYVWSAIDFDLDPEAGNYQVFDQAQGQYVSVPTLSEARDKLTTVRQEFITASGLTHYITVDEIVVHRFPWEQV